ncbi:MAG TPA: hypothetical protein PK280_10705 [Planctomycetota bacterium]|nr:hypothetical protein [Planctomycetota bacterium]
MNRSLNARLSPCGAIGALLLSAGLAAAGEPAGDAVAQARKAVAAQEELAGQVAELVKRDEASQAAADRANLALAEARLILARAGKNPEAEKEALRAVVECREAHAKRVTAAVNAGLACADELDRAERDKAAARAELARAEGNAKLLAAELAKCLTYQTKIAKRAEKGAALGLCSGADLRKAQEEAERLRAQAAEAAKQPPKQPAPRPVPPKPQPVPKPDADVF